MGTDFQFRKAAVAQLTREIGVYVLADLDNVPIYVGQSRDGIRQRVQRHLTSARSDIIANRQIDIWEIAFVWTYPCPDKTALDRLEAQLFHAFDERSQLVNGKIPQRPINDAPPPDPAQIIQVMTDEEREDKTSPEQRLPRQASHYAAIVDHFLTIKDSSEVLRAMNAHFARLQKYHAQMQSLSSDDAPELPL
ncbi:GIY-YIG catalytic domain-containing protein [Cognatiyoonia koreensis]|uniref:GIY-YIG catalytic domain-containing protein n=1 Tax=Cognatiyoonia koreensis TaxID=364200 RepID=A0A1I0N363_9RHOB|nr:GIY-YIG nuclease family protein [Cognatiyoonia koreensis]SEV95083.1 GIY-YIG catalytic domain-containing protein [Cognatiyoonia koreensis]